MWQYCWNWKKNWFFSFPDYFDMLFDHKWENIEGTHIAVPSNGPQPQVAIWIKIILKMLDIHFFQFLASGNCESNSQNVGCLLFSVSGIWPLWIKFSKIGGPLLHFLACRNHLYHNSQYVGGLLFPFLACSNCLNKNSHNIRLCFVDFWPL